MKPNREPQQGPEVAAAIEAKGASFKKTGLGLEDDEKKTVVVK